MASRNRSVGGSCVWWLTTCTCASTPPLSLPDLIHGCPVERGILLDRVRRWHGPTRRRMSACADGIKSVGDSGVRCWRTATNANSAVIAGLDPAIHDGSSTPHLTI